MTRKDLKPCPLCGGTEFDMGHPFVAVQQNRMNIIHCKTCDMQFIPSSETWDEAVEKMNRRAEDGRKK